MEESNQIDCISKISNFMAMTETGDPDTAKQYLMEANWDETLAVNNFFNKIRTNLNSNNNANISGPSYPQNNNANNSNNNNQGFFSYYIFEPLKNLFSSCYNTREVDLEEEDKIFRFLPNKIDDFEKFKLLINRNIGIIILYNSSNILFLNNFITQICRNTTLTNLLKNNFIIYPLLSSTNQAFQIQNMITEKNLIYPSFIFCFNKNHNNNNIFYSNNILIILESETITLESFHNKLIDSLEKINKNINNKINISDKSNLLSDAEILEKQKKEMEALEKQEQNKEELIKEKINEEKKLKEIEKEIENKANIAKNKIIEEPSVDNPDCTTICFRYPDGEKRIERRFLKNNTIQNLYDYVTSLGKEIYTEEESNNFSLYQPFPPKKYQNMENTLENEGLFPNAIIQIKEE